MSGGGIGDELQLDNMFLWRDKSSAGSGIGNIAADTADAPIEIYNLAGVRLGSMTAPGIYVVRQGNIVRKVIVR